MLRLQEVLDILDKNPKWLSDKLGISKSAISRLLSGKTKPTFDRLYEISNRLEVPITDLLEPTPYPSIFATDGNNKSDNEQKSNEVIETLTNENKSLQAQIQALQIELRELKANTPTNENNRLESKLEEIKSLIVERLETLKPKKITNREIKDGQLQFIKEVIEKSNLTKKSINNQLRRSEGFITRFTKDNTKLPHPIDVLKLCKMLNVSLDDILTDEGKQHLIDSANNKY